MNKLDKQDLSFAVLRLPSELKTIMKLPEWQNAIYVGGGYIRAVVSGEKINDIDIFVKSKKDGELLAFKLADINKVKVHTSDNAFTVKTRPVAIQIIHRWVFDKPEDVANSFDFTICCAVIHFNDNKWDSFTDDRFYQDLAGKRLVYRQPIRNEDAGGSLLRVLKYYQRGYRIPLDSLGAVIARLMKGVNTQSINMTDEESVARVITGLLRVVDPLVDPTHEAHLPAQDVTMSNEEDLNLISDELPASGISIVA